MKFTEQSVLWGVALSLFFGGLGLPVPENPLLIGGGYAISQGLSPFFASIILWYFAILSGDFILFSVVRWLFSWPGINSFIVKLTGKKRIELYQNAFMHYGGWTLFLARFTFGIRAAAYVAAGIARYPWFRFVLVDGISVAIQLLLFVALGRYAAERIEWAKATSQTITLFLTGAVVVSISISIGASRIIRYINKTGTKELTNSQRNEFKN